MSPGLGLGLHPLNILFDSFLRMDLPPNTRTIAYADDGLINLESNNIAFLISEATQGLISLDGGQNLSLGNSIF